MRRKTGWSTPVIINDRLKAVLSLRFYFIYLFIFFLFGAVQFLNVLILTLLCVQL